MAILSFGDSPLADFFSNERIPRGAGWASVARIVLRKLDVLDYAQQLDDLRSPPGNRLEALRGDPAGLHSIRVSDRWRIVFRWTENGPALVKVVDYH